MENRNVAQLRGTGAKAAVKKLLCGHVRAMEEGSALFSPMLNFQGGTMDAVIVQCETSECFWMILHAHCLEKDLRHISRQIGSEGEVIPRPELKVYALLGADLREGSVPASLCFPTDHLGASSYLICVDEQEAAAFENDMAQRGARLCSQAEMDLLLIENGVPACGRELDDTINPMEAGLGRYVDIKRPGFVGREALVAAGEPRRGVIGLTLASGGAAHGQNVVHRNKDVGMVTSVCYSPRMKSWIALALVEKPYQDLGRKLKVEADEMIDAFVTALPFEEPAEETEEE